MNKTLYFLFSTKTFFILFLIKNSIYMYVCMCACMCIRCNVGMYRYIYVRMFVCVFAIFFFNLMLHKFSGHWLRLDLVLFSVHIMNILYIIIVKPICKAHDKNKDLFIYLFIIIYDSKKVSCLLSFYWWSSLFKWWK